MATKPREPLPERIKAGLAEALAHAKGELTLKTVVVPEAAPDIQRPVASTPGRTDFLER